MEAVAFLKAWLLIAAVASIVALIIWAGLSRR
mgnify:CR=1 FL=1